MTIVLDGYNIPEKGTFELNINRTFDIKVTAKEAQRQVNRWVLLEVSCVMGAEPPTLLVGTRAVWRVPVVLTASHIGIVGEAGTIDVDVQTGEMNNSIERKAEIVRCAKALAAKMPPYKPHGDVPAEYLATDLKPTRKPGRPERSPLDVISPVESYS